MRSGCPPRRFPREVMGFVVLALRLDDPASQLDAASSPGSASRLTGVRPEARPQGPSCGRCTSTKEES